MQKRMRQGMGPSGNCICPKCGYKKPHARGAPCQDEKCPTCGVSLLREDSYHDHLLKKKKGGK